MSVLKLPPPPNRTERRREWQLWFAQLQSVFSHVLVGDGSPEGAVGASVGTMFLRRDGGANTTLYVKESGTGNTGWTAK